MNIIKFIAKLFILVLFAVSCEEESTSSANDRSINVNTLEDSDLGSPDSWGDIDEYFDLDKNIDLKFYRYDHNSISTNIFFDPSSDTMRLRLFEEYEIVESADIELFLIQDTTQILDASIDDTLWVFSTIFKNVDSLVFNNADDFLHNNQYYTKKLSKDYVKDSSEVIYTDTFDSLTIYVKVDSTLTVGGGLLGAGTAFLDTTVYEENKVVEYTDDEDGEKYFELPGLRVSAENLMIRINTDCNDNGVWDVAESTDGAINQCDSNEDCNGLFICDAFAENSAGFDDNSDGVCFIDRGNELYDKSEPGIQNGDLNNGIPWTKNSIFQDRNCNNDWDTAEQTSAEIDENNCVEELKGQWLTVEDLTFCDVGNGQYDGSEIVTDLDGDENTKLSSELFVVSETMASLLVDYVNSNSPKVMHTIYPNDSLTTKWNGPVPPLIEPFVLMDTISYSYNDILRKKSIFSHPTIQYFEENMGSPYTVAKSEWYDEGDQYDYHMFRKEASGDIIKLQYPEYFKPYGYYDPAQFGDAFWRDSVFVNDTIFYTFNGYLRDGESYNKDKIVSISLPGVILADYLVEESYAVSKELLTDLPIVENSNIEELDCFKVTRSKKMTMLGTGVEYFQENSTWLAKDVGIVKDIVEYQWLGEERLGLSKLELVEDNSPSQEAGNDLGRIFSSDHQVNLNELQNLEEMGNDPYVYNRTGTIQRIGK